MISIHPELQSVGRLVQPDSRRGSAAFRGGLAADWCNALLDLTTLVGQLPRDLLTQALGFRHHLFEALQELP